jgi:hypothetical protein
MGLFKKAGPAKRVATVSGVTPERYFDALAAVLRESHGAGGGLGTESVEKIKGLLAPFEKMGANVDQAMGQVRIEVDTTQRPREIHIRTFAGQKPMGPQTKFAFPGAGQAGAAGAAAGMAGAAAGKAGGAFDVSVEVTAPMATGLLDRLVTAGIRRQIEGQLAPSIDPLLTKAGEACKATVSVRAG